MYIIQSPSFGAKTNICNADNLLTNKELKKLTHLGENIGTSSDSIDMYIGKSTNKLFLYTNTIDFKSNKNNIKISNVNFQNLSNISPYNFVLNKLKDLKKLYKQEL